MKFRPNFTWHLPLKSSEQHRARELRNLTHELFHKSAHENAHGIVHEDVVQDFQCKTHHWVPTKIATRVLARNLTLLTKMYTKMCSANFHMSYFLAHRNRSDFCDLRLRCPSRIPEIATISKTRERREVCVAPTTMSGPCPPCCLDVVELAKSRITTLGSRKLFSLCQDLPLRGGWGSGGAFGFLGAPLP